MKITTLVLNGLLLLTTVSFSQTEQGNYIISGTSTIEFARNHSTLSNNGITDPGAEVDINSFKLISGIGYFVLDNLALGLSGHYSHTEESIYQMNEFVFMPTLMYFIPLYSAFRPYAQIGAGYANATEKSDYQKEFFSGFGYGGGIGLAYFINNNIAIDLGIQLTGTKLTYSENDAVKIKGSNFGSAIGLAVTF